MWVYVQNSMTLFILYLVLCKLILERILGKNGGMWLEIKSDVSTLAAALSCDCWDLMQLGWESKGDAK